MKIVVLDGPRISSSEGRQCVENTGFAGEIAFSPHELGDPAGTRTPDLRLKRALLYQLSYWVEYDIAGETGLCGGPA